MGEPAGARKSFGRVKIRVIGHGRQSGRKSARGEAPLDPAVEEENEMAGMRTCPRAVGGQGMFSSGQKT